MVHGFDPNELMTEHWLGMDRKHGALRFTHIPTGVFVECETGKRSIRLDRETLLAELRRKVDLHAAEKKV